MDQKELYLITMVDGTKINCVAKSFSECILMFGEECIVKIEKLEYKEGVE